VNDGHRCWRASIQVVRECVKLCQLSFVGLQETAVLQLGAGRHSAVTCMPLGWPP